jgi:hypothetical protein
MTKSLQENSRQPFSPVPQAISQEALNNWRNHPVSRAVLQYLQDYRLQMAEKVAESLFQGQSISQDRVDEVALRCEIMGDVANISADDINTFYEVKPQAPEGEPINGL